MSLIFCSKGQRYLNYRIWENNTDISASWANKIWTKKVLVYTVFECNPCWRYLKECQCPKRTLKYFFISTDPYFPISIVDGSLQVGMFRLAHLPWLEPILSRDWWWRQWKWRPSKRKEAKHRRGSIESVSIVQYFNLVYTKRSKTWVTWGQMRSNEVK